MRRPRYFDSYKALPRMAWNPRNLFNIWSRSYGPHAQGKVTNNINRFQESSLSLFKQRWQSKKLVRAYHCDYIPEKKFIRWYLPERLPDPMARHKSRDAVKEEVAWARPNASKPKEEDSASQLAPISSLMFAELERRIDVVVFRSCFAHSIHAARQLVVHGKVTLNGLKESDPNTRLNPGDLISVQPEAMTILNPPPRSKKAIEPSEDEEAAPASESESKEHDEGSATEADLSSKSLDKPFKLAPFAAPFLFIPPYLEVSFPTCSAVYVRHPTARPNYSEIATPYDADGEIVRFAWEWYRKNRTRLRGRKLPIRERMEKGKSGWSGI